MSEKFTPAIFALRRLHAELGGKIKDNAREAVRLRASMMHVEAVIKLLDPTVSVSGIAARRRYYINPPFRRSGMFPAILGILREAQKPLTAPEIGALLIERHKLKLRADQVHNFSGNINQNIKRHPDAIVGDGARPQRWLIKK